MAAESEVEIPSLDESAECLAELPEIECDAETQGANYIEQRIGTKLTVCEVADAVSIHDRYLYTLFLRYEGISPKEYILKRKLETAADLLTHTDLTVVEISAAAGFADVYGFSRIFRAKMGTSPSRYRKTTAK